MDTIRKIFKKLFLMSLFTHNFYAGDLGFFQPVPREVIKTIASVSGGTSLPQTSKFFSELIHQSRINSYVDYVARTNLFNHKFELDEFLNDQYKDMPAELKKQCNKSYNDLMNEPIFFMKFVNLYQDLTIPKNISERIDIKKSEIKVDQDKIIFLTIVQSKVEDEKEKKLIIVNTKLGNIFDPVIDQSITFETIQNNFKAVIKEIVQSYPKFIRLVFSDTLTYDTYFKFNEYETYQNWFANRIIQDNICLSIATTPFFNPYCNISNLDNSLLFKLELTRDVLRCKDVNGQTLLSYYPKRCLALAPDLYINELDEHRNSALSTQITYFQKFLKTNNPKDNEREIAWGLFLENIKALIDHNITFSREDLLYLMVFTDPKLLSILKNGKNFYKLVNECDEQGYTILDILLSIQDVLKKLDRTPEIIKIIKFFGPLFDKNKIELPFRKLGAISGKDVQNGKTPLHVYAEQGNDEIFLKIIQIPYYQQFIIQKDNAGNTPLDYAYRSNNVQIITALKNTEIIQAQTKRRRQLFQKVGITIGITGILMLLYQNSKKYGWFSSIQQYIRPKKQ